MRGLLPLLWALTMSVLPKPAGPAPVALRVMTYNVHSCKGRDGEIRPDRIAKIIEEERPDIVALQEIRVGRVDARTIDKPQAAGQGVVPPAVGEPPLPPPAVLPPRRPSKRGAGLPFSDQPRAIADAAGMYSVFYPLVRLAKEDYGIAILSRRPLRLVRAANLPTSPRRPLAERRGAIWAEVVVDGLAVQILNTHLGLSGAERRAQAQALLEPEWLGGAAERGPFVLLGDFNARPSDPAYKALAARAADAAAAALGKSPRTWPSVLPLFRLDHVMASAGIRALSAGAPRTKLTRVGSDHLPLVVDLELPR